MMVDAEYLEAQKAEGMDLDALLNPSLIAHNAAIRDLPADLTVAMHLCRGNIPKGQKAAVGGYQGMANTLFKKLDYDRFALEYDNSEVTGDFSPLQQLPKDKLVVLGLVTTKDAELEEINDLKAQVFEAADIIAKVSSILPRKQHDNVEKKMRPLADSATGARQDSRASSERELGGESILWVFKRSSLYRNRDEPSNPMAETGACEEAGGRDLGVVLKDDPKSCTKQGFGLESIR